MSRIRFHGCDLSVATRDAPRSTRKVTRRNALRHIVCPIRGGLQEDALKNLLRIAVLAPALMFAAACGKKDDNAMADTALSRDLALANQVAPYSPVDSMEAGLAATSAPSRTASRTPARSTTRRTSSSSGATRSSSGTSASTTTSSGGEVVVKKNTKRDAAIGAAAGAVIGATTSRDKVKGAVVGGVVGGVLGAVIGNNVDVKKTKRPPQ